MRELEKGTTETILSCNISGYNMFKSTTGYVKKISTGQIFETYTVQDDENDFEEASEEAYEAYQENLRIKNSSIVID